LELCRVQGLAEGITEGQASDARETLLEATIETLQNLLGEILVQSNGMVTGHTLTSFIIMIIIKAG
jgi:hypothetical protein